MAVNGGLISGAGFGGGGPAYEIPMPERWLLGDAISSSAAVAQVEEIPTGLTDYSHLRVEADFALAPAPLKNSVIADPLDECLIYHPGLSTSALDGFIGMTVYFEVGATLYSGSTIVGTSSKSQNILTYGINSELTGTTPDNGNSTYVLREWAFESDPTGAIPVSLIIPLDPSADQVIVEARAWLFGLRGGIGDPGAGWVNAAFQNVDANTPQTGVAPSLPCPFAVRRISAAAIAV